MRLPLIHAADWQIVVQHLPLACCTRCRGNNRVRFSWVLSHALLGLDVNGPRDAARRISTIRRIVTRGARNGLFLNLARSGVFTSHVDWSVVASGRFASSNPFRPIAIRRRIVQAYEAVVDPELRERRRELAAAACGAGDGIALDATQRARLNGLTNRARYMVARYATAGCGGGADAIAELGEARFVEHLNAIAEPLGLTCIALARDDRDPQRRLDAWLIDNVPRTGNMGPCPTPLAVPREWIARGQHWTVHGLPARIVGNSLDLDGARFEFDGLEHLPADIHGITLPRVMPRMSVPAPF